MLGGKGEGKGDEVSHLEALGAHAGAEGEGLGWGVPQLPTGHLQQLPARHGSAVVVPALHFVLIGGVGCEVAVEVAVCKCVWRGGSD